MDSSGKDATVPSDALTMSVSSVPSDALTIYWPSRASAIPSNQAEETPVKDTLSSSSSHCLTLEDVQVEAPGSQHDGAERGKWSRGKNYSPNEDENLCYAWLVASQDMTGGTSQQMDRFFKRLAFHFNERNKPSPARSIESVKKRWGIIRRTCAKFTTFVFDVERRNPRVSQADKVEIARELYSKDECDKPFIFEKCWRILYDSPKWKVDNGFFPAIGDSLAGHVEGTLVDGADRHEGHKKAKFRDPLSPSFTTTSSTHVEGLSQELLEDIEEKRNLRELKKAAFEAQRIFFEYQKIEADRWREEAYRRREEEDRRRDDVDRRREEALKRKEENDILALKVDGLDEESKTYFMEQKRNILARRKRSNPEVGRDVKPEVPAR